MKLSQTLALNILQIATIMTLTIPAHADSISTIGYGSSDAVYSATNQEYFFMGFSMGIEETLDTPNSKKTEVNIVAKQLRDGKSLSAVRAAQNLVDTNAVVLTGFPTSHEALLAATIAKKNDTIFISAAASHSDMATNGPLIYTLGESVEFSKKALVTFTNKEFKNKRGIVLIDKTKVFSVNQADIIKQVSSSTKQPTNTLDFSKLNENGNVTERIIKAIKEGIYGYILLTTYADNAISLLEQLIKADISVPIVANSAWTIGNIEMVRRLLIKYSGDVYCVASIIKGMKSAHKFEEHYQYTYGKLPETEMYYGYDLGVIVGQVLSRINGSVTKESFKEAFSNNPCFEGATTGTICFPVSGGHGKREIYWLKYDGKTGFRPMSKIR